MGAATNYLEDAILNHVLRNTSYTSPTTVYLALFTSAPGEIGGGTEVSGGNYSRQPVSFTAPSGGVTSNDSNVNFPVATADWGTITHFAIFDAETSGNMLLYDALTQSKVVQVGDQLIFKAGDLSITLD